MIEQGVFLGLNADFGRDQDLDSQWMPLVSLANIACGGHAGSVDSMRAAVHLAHQYGVRIGAAPSYPDRANLGQRSLSMHPSQLVFSITAQLWAMKAVCIEEGVSVAYVKLHGALYRDAAKNPVLADQIAQLIFEIDPDLSVMAPLHSELLLAAAARGLTTISESSLGHGDRDDAASSVGLDTSPAADWTESQQLALALVGQVQSLSVHGENYLELAQTLAIRQFLLNLGVRLCAESGQKGE
ncbi:LamB/YcsF family protein [uncultured Deefgea sp.]|uniref:LamB/YcsF family protein n=1 Tax=uncultured Deefgea sp. TaxID=1304914 RepID=UPI00260CD46A|nr:LamB/YcsF family protein [uncultured Deefgea sp.]